jgi:(2Fe-2S) ferredoxin
MSGRHLRICVSAGTSGRLGCGVRGGTELLSEIRRRQTTEVTWRVSGAQCLGGCSDGPNAVVEPDNIWYEALQVDDAGQLIAHCQSGVQHVGKLATREPSEDGED